MLQVSEDQYGFGYVNVYNPAELAARALIRTCPPWDQVSFWEDGHAKEDFSCIIVGFGSHGQEALKQLVMNSLAMNGVTVENIVASAEAMQN